MIDLGILEQLNAPTKEERLANLRDIAAGTQFPEAQPQYVNNHIHTKYSFSPYSPTAAVFSARMEGLCTAGIVDHDSVAGAREFWEAASILDMPVTTGSEFRVSLTGTRIEGRMANNPDQKNIAYVIVHSIPRSKVDEYAAFIRPYLEARIVRNRKMVDNINREIPNIDLDYDSEVEAYSLYKEGGSVTERHVMYGLAKKLVLIYGKGAPLIEALARYDIPVSEKQKELLLDVDYPFYEYDLLGMFKGGFIERVYVDATDECPPIGAFVKMANDLGAIPTYAYLGDVTASVTGDKKPQKLEDSYLDELFVCLKEEGVRGVAYMPTRNTREQLLRVRALCEEHDLIQISGEDINQPRQGFVIKAMDDPLFSNLIDSTWMLIENENR